MLNMIPKTPNITSNALASRVPYTLKEGSAEITLSGRYVCVYMCDKAGNYSYVYGSRNIFDNYFKKNLKTNSVHDSARNTAFSGKRISYDWFENITFPVFFNTIAIPLTDDKGKINTVLFVIKMLDELSVNQNKSIVVAEKAGQSFVRVIMQAREEEKRLITSAIHDQLGNLSVRINALIELLKEDIKEKSKKDVLNTLSSLQDSFKDSVSAMKEIITSLRPPQLDTVGLNLSIQDLLDKTAKTAKIKIKYSYKIQDKTILTDTVKLVLYRTVQEALSNTVKYAKAKNLTVELKEDKSYLYLNIKDDGKGFKPQVHRSAKSLGLAGMKENIESLKGTMKLTSKLGQGTAISVKCPKSNYQR